MAEEKKNEEVKESVEEPKKDEIKTEIKDEKQETMESSKASAAKDSVKKEIEPDEKKDEPKKSNIPGNLLFYPEIRDDIPEIRPGDVVKVSYRVVEGGKERIQLFEGTVIAIKNSGIAKNITVRKTSYGISIERIFPLNSKLVQKIEVKKHSRVRRAKLYYLRKLKGKAARLKELR